MYILVLQNIPTYPGAQPLEQSPFDELQGILFEQCPLHWFVQFFSFSQPVRKKQITTVKKTDNKLYYVTTINHFLVHRLLVE